MKKILFTTEFSKHAPEVFNYATELAYYFNARLVVMYAYGISESQLATKQAIEKRASDSTEKMIDFVTKNLPESYRQHIQVDYVTRKGVSTKAVLAVALEEDIDLIVMGMTGKTNALNTILGSTAMGVLAKAECPVLMIPATAKFEGIDNIVYTTNFEFRDLAAINYLKKWSKVFKAPIHCLHVIEPGENELNAVKNKSILSKTFKRHKRMTFEMVQGELNSSIIRYAKSRKADIITMMSHKRSFITRMLESGAVKEMAHDVSIPLLVIKDNAYELDASSGEWLKVVNSIA